MTTTDHFPSEYDVWERKFHGAVADLMWCLAGLEGTTDNAGVFSLFRRFTDAVHDSEAHEAWKMAVLRHSKV